MREISKVRKHSIANLFSFAASNCSTTTLTRPAAADQQAGQKSPASTSVYNSTMVVPDNTLSSTQNTTVYTGGPSSAENNSCSINGHKRTSPVREKLDKLKKSLTEPLLQVKFKRYHETKLKLYDDSVKGC